MNVRAVILAAAGCGAMLAAAPIAASANLIWCVDDPPIHVVTPGGHALEINNMVYMTRESGERGNDDARRITGSAEAAPDGHGGTLITVRVYLPDGISAHVVASDYRYQVWSQGYGEGDDAVTLVLDVPVS